MANLGQALPFVTTPGPIIPRVIGISPPPGESSPGSSGGSGPPAQIPICPPGTYYDPYSNSCQPTLQGPTLGGNFPAPGGSQGEPTTATSQTTTSVETPSPSTVNVNVSQAVAVTDQSASNAIQNVSSAIGQALLQSDAITGQAVQSAVNTIGSVLGYYLGSVSNTASSAFTNLSTTLNDISGFIQADLNSSATAITGFVNDLVAPLAINLGSIITLISNQIGGLAGAIGAAVGQVVPQIIAAVENPLGALTGVLGQIESDVATSVAQLTQVGSDISGGFSSLDGIAQRVWSQYSSFTEAQTGYPAEGDLHHDLSGIAKAIAGLVTTLASGSAYPKLSDQIQTLCAGKDIDALLNKPWTPPEDESFFASTWHIYMKGLATLVTWIASILPAIQKARDEAAQRLNQNCAIGLLSPSELVAAVQRGILDDATALMEAAKGDLNQSRFQILKDLAIEELSPAQIIEAFYRGIITQGDYASALAKQGFTQGQQNILQALAIRLLSVADLTELFRRQQIDKPAFDRALKAQQWDDAQRQALIGLAFRPPRMQEAIDGISAYDALAQMGAIAESDTNRIPESVSIAAAAEGLSIDAMNARWLSHWQTGAIGSWVTLYFRGLVSLETVRAVMGRQYIPPSLQTTLIEAARPIVQYRTISNMLRIGQIDIQTAGRLLMQHGYSAENAQLLITYAQRPGAAAAAKKAQSLHAVSLGIAHKEYIDGSISENEYYQILLQHGYTIDGANTEIAVENANQAMIRRKENAQLIVDEYGAGLINEQTALAQLAAQGLTVNELAKYAHKIRVFRVKNGKLPSEADLNHFLQLAIIDQSTYKAQLQAQGYSAQAADWFYQYRTHPAAPTATATTATPTPAGG